MIHVYEDHFLTIESDVEKSILIYTWKESTAEMTLDDLMVRAKRILGEVLQRKVRFIIGADTDFKFPLAPEIQEELNKSILSAVNSSDVEKFAHVYSSEIIAQMSVEQFFDENVHKTYEDKYFDSLSDAIKWCI